MSGLGLIPRVSGRGCVALLYFSCVICRLVEHKVVAEPAKVEIDDHLPDGWERTFGSSGRGRYYKCGACLAKGAYYDDLARPPCVDLGTAPS